MQPYWSWLRDLQGCLIIKLILRLQLLWGSNKINVEVYLTNPVGIGEHSNIVEAIEEELNMIAKYEDQVEVIKKYFKK